MQLTLFSFLRNKKSNRIAAAAFKGHAGVCKGPVGSPIAAGLDRFFENAFWQVDIVFLGGDS